MIESEHRMSTTEESLIGTPSVMLNDLALDGSSVRNGKDDARDWTVFGADEIFRAIYTRSGTGVNDILAVCSAIGGEGRTTVALGLAATIAQDFPDRQILLVEADLKHPVLAKDFGVDTSPGLADCLMTARPVQFAYRPTFLDNLTFLPAGEVPRGAGRLLASSRMATAVDVMRQTHDVVILDTPPVLIDSDALILSDLADVVIFVVRAGVTPVAQINKALEQVDEEKLRGVVLNAAQSSIPRWLRRLCVL
jgi:capsular exopolysaccharide synthesis family protein